jgi:serine/threonine protein kinase
VKAGDLRQRLKNRSIRLTWRDKAQLAFELACAMAYLHSKNIIHRDLKAKNCLVLCFAHLSPRHDTQDTRRTRRTHNTQHTGIDTRARCASLQVSDRGEVKLCDFGFARIAERTPRPMTLCGTDHQKMNN